MEIRYSREMNHNYMIEVPGPPDGGGERILL